MFLCQYYEIFKNSFYYRAPLVAARISSCSEKYLFQKIASRIGNLKGLLWKGNFSHNNYSGTNSNNLWGMPLSYSYSVELHRSNHRKCSKKESVLKNFAKFTGKYLCQSIFFNFIQKKTLAQVFSSEFCKVFIFFLFFSFYYNKIHQVTNYIAIQNKINKTRQNRTNKRKQNKTKEKINK